MVFRWAAALCESMKPKSARLAGLVVAAVAVAAVAADTAVVVETAVAVETAAVVGTAVVVAAAHAAGNCRASSRLSKADNVGETGSAHHISLS
jgi:2-methylaconitate cis-trans-isomerase PrpF